MSDLAARVGAALEQAARRELDGAVRIENLTRLSGGASRELWSFDAVTGGERRGLILRRDPDRSADAEQINDKKVTRSDEYDVQRLADAAGVPVPEMVFKLDPEDGLGDAYVMGLVAGEALGHRLVRDEKYARARETLAAEAGQVLARIHGIDATQLPNLPELPIRATIDMYRGILDGFGEPQPVFELAMRWMEANLPPPPKTLSLVHGDFRTGNFLADETGMTAVLDWEIAHLGDPMCDLGWFCVPSWRFGAVDKPAGGFGSREDLISAYERESGRAIDRDTFRFWEVFGIFRWGVMCQMQAFTHLNGVNRSVELCAIGRRACETEVDLLLEIGGEN